LLAYVLKRLAMTALVLLVVMTFLAALVHLIPGDPVTTILGPRADPELSKIVRDQMQLDLPVPEQIWNFITGALHGDLGVDFVSDEDVTSLVFSALPHTIVLAVSSLVLAIGIGVPLGVYAATHPNTWLDRVMGLISVSFITVPSYLAALLLVLIFSVHLHWLPAIGTGDFSDPVDYLRHLILPAIALGLAWIGYFARLVRASMLEVLNTNYIRTAHAFGIRERVIFYRYALKNAIIPAIAVLGVGLGTLMGYAIFVEVIFARPGLGTLIYDSIESRNYPVVRGGVLVVAILFVTCNLLADLSYRFLDPRIRAEQGL
jgi:peptide/nickel transport system permease protein